MTNVESMDYTHLSAFWEPGYTDLPACGPRRGSLDGLVRPGGKAFKTRPSRGPRPHEADDTKTSKGAASPGCLPRSGDFYAGTQPPEAAMT
jgi:hypothetical protein